MSSQQDAPGPDHAPEVEALRIEGAARQRFPSVSYANGVLTELLNAQWADMFSAPVEHLYLIENLGERREEWYEHRHTTDRYVLINGEITVALFDARHESPSFGTLDIVALEAVGSGGYSGLAIPPRVWHSFRNDSERVLLMNAKTPGYNRDSPDKYRLSMPHELTSFTWEGQAAR
jgi:dTDP-4-dehydrorhamnose 3,5-epimerase